MSFIFEQPFWVGFIGLVLTLVLAGVWAFAGQRLAGIAALVALCLTAALVFVGTAVETDREAIRRTLAQIAKDVESNDLPSVLSHVASSAPSIAAEASNELPRYQFESVEVKWQMLEIDVRESPSGQKEALATFNVVVTGDLRSAGVGSQTVPRYVEVNFVEEDDQWKVAGYLHDDAMRGFKKKPESQGETGR